MTREEALRSYTSEAARAAFAEEELGSIEIGKRADLAVLTRDILAGPAQEMLQTRVCMTIVDGRIVHEA